MKRHLGRQPWIASAEYLRRNACCVSRQHNTRKGSEMTPSVSVLRHPSPNPISSTADSPDWPESEVIRAIVLEGGPLDTVKAVEGQGKAVILAGQGKTVKRQ